LVCILYPERRLINYGGKGRGWEIKIKMGFEDFFHRVLPGFFDTSFGFLSLHRPIIYDGILSSAYIMAFFQHCTDKAFLKHEQSVKFPRQELLNFLSILPRLTALLF